MKVYESIVSESLLAQFPLQGPVTLMNFAASCAGLPEALSVISIIWPRIAEVGGLIFIAEFYGLSANGRITTEIAGYEQGYQNLTDEQKQTTERIINAVSVGQLLQSESVEVLENKELLDSFAHAIKFFGTLRLTSLFPEKQFCVELGENIAGEEGIVITFYQTEYR